MIGFVGEPFTEWAAMSPKTKEGLFALAVQASPPWNSILSPPLSVDRILSALVIVSHGWLGSVPELLSLPEAAT